MRFTATVLIAIVSSWLSLSSAQAAVVDFEDLELGNNSAAPGDVTQAPFESRRAVFNRTWIGDCCAGAWAYSNQTDLSTAGFTNPYAAYVPPAGGGVEGSSNFAIANNQAQGESTVTLPGPSRVLGTYVANTTYAYLATVDGNDGGFNFVKGPFGDGDWFRLDFVGIDDQGQEVGVEPFFLADYRDGKSEAVSDWTWVDLSGLGENVSRLEFRMDSTDIGQFGMNTPAYFAIDNLTYEVVPEPTALLMTGLAVLMVAVRRRRGMRAAKDV